VRQRLMSAVAGGAVGYVLGARAGRARFEMLRGSATRALQAWPRDDDGHFVWRAQEVRRRIPQTIKEGVSARTSEEDVAWREGVADLTPAANPSRSQTG
jgi:hypothetical protein